MVVFSFLWILYFVKYSLVRRYNFVMRIFILLTFTWEKTTDYLLRGKFNTLYGSYAPSIRRRRLHSRLWFWCIARGSVSGSHTLCGSCLICGSCIFDATLFCKVLKYVNTGQNFSPCLKMGEMRSCVSWGNLFLQESKQAKYVTHNLNLKLVYNCLKDGRNDCFTYILKSQKGSAFLVIPDMLWILQREQNLKAKLIN